MRAMNKNGIKEISFIADSKIKYKAKDNYGKVTLLLCIKN